MRVEGDPLGAAVPVLLGEAVRVGAGVPLAPVAEEVAPVAVGVGVCH